MRPLLFIGLCGVCVAQNSPQWTLVTDNHFEVYSQTGGDNAQRALQWFEGLRSVFLQGGLLSDVARPSDLPALRIIAFRSQKEYQEYRLHSGADAYFVASGTRNYIVMPSLDATAAGPASHEFCHFFLRAAGLKLPAWLNEGLAEYASTLRVSEDGYSIGGKLPARTYILQSRKWLSPAALFAFDPQRRSREESAIFYAQSWALVDMLMESPAYRPRFKDLIANPTLQDPQTVMADLVRWVNLPHNSHSVTAVFPSPPPSVTQTVSPAEADAMLADLLAADGSLDLARAKYSKLSRDHPHDADLHAALGSIAFSKGERETALREWQQAVDDGVKDAELCYRYALLADEAEAPRPQIRAALERAIALRPGYDDARYKLALLESNESNFAATVTQLQAMAVPHNDRAFAYWTALANALTELDKRAEAIAAAHHAEELAKTDEDAKYARSLALMAGTDLHVQMTRDSNGNMQMVTTRVKHGTVGFNPFIEPSDDIHTVQGDLTHVLCTAGKLTGFRLTSPTGSIDIEVGDPTHVLIENGPKEFYCGEQKKSAVKVDYALTERKNLLRGMTFLK